MAEPRTSVDICIATYKRPEGLARLLKSIRNQVTDGTVDITVCVADNDARASARAVVEQSKSSDLEIRYAVEPRQNIALARNRSVKLGSGELIVFVDDDEEAVPHWLAALVATSRAHNADAVQGTAWRRFGPGAREWLIRSGAFDFPVPPTGSTSGYIPSTRNCLVRRRVLEDLDGPFNPSFGLTGGSDTEMFTRLAARGAKVVFCSEAKIWEDFPADRVSLLWIARRAARNGANTLRTLEATAPAMVPPALARARQELLVLGPRIPRQAVNRKTQPRVFVETVRRVSFNLGVFGHVAGFEVLEYATPWLRWRTPRRWKQRSQT